MTLSGVRLRGDARVLEPWQAWIETVMAAEESRQEVLPGTPAGFFKGSRLRGRSALRHAFRAWAGVADIPRFQEFDNLAWLRANGFAAPRPLAAGVRRVGGLPRYQFLVTEHLADHPTLQEWLHVARGLPRIELLDALATDLARLHALGFVHRDLFLRNLLVDPGAAHPRPIFLDAWRGGPRPGLRGPLHDLACLFLDVPTVLDGAEQARLLGTYREARVRAGHPLRRGWLDRLTTRRAAVHAREAARRSDPLEPRWRPPKGEERASDPLHRAP